MLTTLMHASRFAHTHGNEPLGAVLAAIGIALAVWVFARSKDGAR